jgi:putative ABC transport system permease protein
MNRPRLFLWLMLKAVWVRKDRALTALISITVVATMATVALTVYSGLESKFSREFRNFGANVIVTAPEKGLNAADLATVKAKTAGAEAVPVGYAIAHDANGANDANATPVVVGGAELEAFKNLNSWWSLNPVNGSGGDALVGFRAAEALSPNGKPFALRYNGKTVTIQPAAIFHSGAEDDSRVYVSLQQFFDLTGMQPNTVQLRITGTPAAIEQQVRTLSASLPQAEVKPVRQITAAQTAVLSKTRSIVLAVSVVVVILIMICMVATLTGSVLERSKDFAVMKALGASNRAVNLLFAGEATLTSLLGAVAGFIVGSGIAFWIGEANFGAAIMPRIELLLPVACGSIILALLASTAPLRILRRIQPAVILRGE